MMSKERATRFTAASALGVAVLSLGLSAWTIGCRDRVPAPERTAATPVTLTATPAPVAVAKSAPAVIPVAATEPVHVAEPTGPGATRAEVKHHAAAPSSLHGDFAVKRLVVTRGIDKREPLAGDALHAGDGPLYAFVELANPTDDAHGVEVTFERDGSTREVGHIKLEVPAQKSRWRTWGRTTLVDKPGAWTAIVRDANGAELARTSFTIE